MLSGQVYRLALAAAAEAVVAEQQSREKVIMSRLESYSAYLECPRCGRKGNAVWEENENPVHNDGNLARILKTISDGFHKGAGTDRAGNPEILCDQCKIPVKP